MSKKLPLEIQRNYSIKDKDTEWHLSCLMCDKAWKLQKPGKGEKIHGGNILHLLEHTASHTSTEEAAEEATEEPVVEQVVEPPTSQVKVHQQKKSVGPLNYAVEWFGSPTLCHMVKVSHFKEPDFKLHDTVLQISDNHYRVVVKAANQKHAQLVGERLIQKHFIQQKKSM